MGWKEGGGVAGSVFQAKDPLRKLMRKLPLMFVVSVKTTLDLQSHSLVADIHTQSILSMVDKYCGCVVNLCVDEWILEFITGRERLIRSHSSARFASN